MELRAGNSVPGAERKIEKPSGSLGGLLTRTMRRKRAERWVPLPQGQGPAQVPSSILASLAQCHGGDRLHAVRAEVGRAWDS